jgi:hypothetical protein
MVGFGLRKVHCHCVVGVESNIIGDKVLENHIYKFEVS